MKVRVEDAHLRDPVDRQLVAGGAAPDRLRVGAVVDAERLLPVLADVGLHPGDAVACVAADDAEAQLRAVCAARDRELCVERALDDVAGHYRSSQSVGANLWPRWAAYIGATT